MTDNSQLQTSSTPSTHYVAAIFFLLMIAGLFALAVATFFIKPDKLKVDDPSFERVVTGKTTLEFEDKFEQELAGRDYIIAPWSGFSYAAFKTGDRKVVAGKNGWVFFHEEFQYFPEAKVEYKHKLEVIEQVRDYLAERGILLVVALLPSKARVYEEYLPLEHFPHFNEAMYDDFRKDLLQRGILTPDLKKFFFEQKKDRQMFLKTDTHWTPEGSEAVAEYLALQVRKDCPALNVPEGRFVTEKGVEEDYDGDLLKFLNTGKLRPVVGPKGERITPHTTRSGGGGEGGLFDEQLIGITLVGTSFSFMHHLNFEGALKAAFQSDVLNLATEGEGPLKPMAAYLKDTNLSVNPPSLLIWEIPERFIPVSYKEVDFGFLKDRKLAADVAKPISCEVESGEAE